MIVQHNMMAENADRIFRKNVSAGRRASERLSSGYRINRAADDAAGLSISEKLRTQIRGLEMAGKNVQDAVSFLQVADGGMEEITNVMQRMRELCVKSANDTYVDEDRNAIQEEVNTLAKCVDEIIDRTEFNTKKVLNLGADGVRYEETVVGHLPSNVTTGGYLNLGPFPTSTSMAQNAFAEVDFSSVKTAADVQALVGNGFYTTCCTCDNKYNIRFVDNQSEPAKNVGRNPVFDVNVSGLTNGADVVNAICKAVNTNHYTEFMVKPGDSSVLYVYDYRMGQQSYPDTGNGLVVLELIHTDAIYEEPSRINVQAGPNANQLVALDMPMLSAAMLGVDTLSVKSNVAANQSLQRIDDAFEVVNMERAKIGAMQNRMEHALSYAGNARENQQAAESRIRDVDMAEGMVEYAGLNILQQVAQSMTAQANQNSQMVLSVLR